METLTATAAQRIAQRTALAVAGMRADADAAEARGDLEGAAALRLFADSRERSTSRAHAGAKIGRA